MSFTSFMIRYTFAKGDKKRDAGLTIPEDVKRFCDISYGPNKMQVLDVYRPKDVEGLLPVIVSVHGGAWMYGDKELYQYYCMSLAQRGFAVVNFTYRLAPEYKWPAGIEDTNLVFGWLLENAQMYGFDTKNLFAVGDSAGAHMLTTYGAMLTNPEYAAQFDFPMTKGVTLNAVALNCGKYDMTEMIHPQTKEDKNQLKLARDILTHRGTESELRWISPIYQINSAFPPAYIMTANNDFLKAQAPMLEKKLTEVGVAHTYKVYGSESNPLGHVFHCDMKSEDAKICNDEECQFFRKYLVS